MKQLFIFMIFVSSQTYAQRQLIEEPIDLQIHYGYLTYDYDISGNQTLRNYTLLISSTRENKTADKINLLPEKEEKAFEIFPNPTNGPLYINWKKDEINSIMMFDLTGREIKNFTMVKNSNSLDLNISNLKPGIYIIKIITKSGDTISRKLIKK